MSNVGYDRLLTRPVIEGFKMFNIGASNPGLGPVKAKGAAIVRHCERSAAISDFLAYGQPKIASCCWRRLESGDKETVLFRALSKP